jgi:hypothetical protein
MKHMHHILPKHMGGTDEKSNLVELTIEEHAEAHRKLYEEHGLWQDYLAWKGLAGLITSDECKFISMIEGGKRGSAIANGGFNYTDGKEIKKFMPWEVPEGWERIKVNPVRKIGVGSGTKGRKWYHNPETNEKIALLQDEDIPTGWVPGQGKKKKSKCFWYNNGKTEGQFELDNGPEGWKRGRLKRVSVSL